MADGANDRRIEAAGVPSRFGCVKQLVDRLVLPIGPVMARQVVPQVFHRIQLGRIGRQIQERDVWRADQLVRSMISRTVPGQDRLHIGFQPLRQLGQKEIDDARVQTRCDQSFGLAGRGTGCRQDIDESVLNLPDGTRTRTGSGPDSGQCPLLAEPSFVFMEDL